MSRARGECSEEDTALPGLTMWGDVADRGDEVERMQDGTWAELQRVAASREERDDLRRRNEQDEQEMTIQFSTMHDALTGLPNRALFVDRLRLTLARLHRRPDRGFAVMLMEFEFEDGAEAEGELRDALLLEMTRRLHERVRPQDTVARFGRDVFAVLLDEAGLRVDVAKIADRLQAATRKPIVVDGQATMMPASVGVVLVSEEYLRADDVLQAAALAVAMAKIDGDGQHAFAPELYSSGARIQPWHESRRNQRT